MATSNGSNLCAMCMKEGGKACSGCHDMRYCSADCQKSDWPVHKLVCKPLKGFSDSDRPQEEGMEYRRALYFPENESRPRFIWIRVFLDTDGFPTYDHRTLPVETQGVQNITTVTCNFMLGRELDRQIGVVGFFIQVNEDENLPIGLPNKSMAIIDPELEHCNNGPIIIQAAQHSSNWRDGACDIGPIEFRHFVDALRYRHFCGRPWRRVGPASEEDHVQGIIMNCEGDKLVSPDFPTDLSTAMLARSMCDQPTDVTIGIADRVGIPLVIKKVPHSLAWRDRETVTGTPNLHNPTAALLFCADLDLTRYTDAPMEEVNRKAAEVSKLGTFIVVRKDGEALHPILFQKLMVYIREKITKLTRDERSSSSRHEIVLASASKEDFESWDERDFAASYTAAM
ncbi:hypothetical protein FB567DRAFT_490698 [Paraphoma chrysanthemicola]|uniref:MYND-type domain-containing protein n=1 Tax=Paraphoma chrysanthemicola TaxID=798071 RepID=A0A8K0RF12_9PLEO|nr:hypothetical protein FB567DRAFT_490698 [Paraphoma chrysanthemicola]